MSVHSMSVPCRVPYSFRSLSIRALAACIMERWDSYYHQNYYDGYPGMYSGASHVRYPFSVDQCRENETLRLANRHYNSIFTSATERGAQSWASFYPERLGSESEVSPPDSLLSPQDPQAQVYVTKL